MPLAVTPKVASQMTVLREKGKTRREIANDLGVHKNTVARYLSPRRRRKYNSRQNERHHQNWIITTIDNKRIRIRVKKRDYPGACELCGKKPRFPGWHHWDDNHPKFGIWVCHTCHQWAEGVDRGLEVEKYKELKVKFSQV